MQNPGFAEKAGPGFCCLRIKIPLVPVLLPLVEIILKMMLYSFTIIKIIIRKVYLS